MSSVGSHRYPPIKSPVYSLTRLCSLLEREEPLPETFAVGGRYIVAGPYLAITDQAMAITLPAPLAGASASDLVVVEVNKADFSFNLDTKEGRLKAWRKFEVMVQANSASRFSDREYSLGKAKIRSHFLRRVREYLNSVGLHEVETPTIVINPGMEPELEPFQIQFKNGREPRALFLATSPELHLKQLLAHGFSDIFEIKSVYRNEELTEVHEPEFQMLEWYRAFANLDAIEADLVGLVQFLSGGAQPVARFTVSELFALHTGLSLEPETSREDLLALAKRLNLAPSERFGFNDLFHLIWVSCVESKMPKGPLLLKHYPPSQAALSRLGEHGWAERFELYWDGTEIANAFHELNDPLEQRRRFERDQKLRVEYGRTPLKIDENFMRALEYGMPPSGGIALGLDRLFMVLHGFQNLRTTRAFSVRHEFEG